MAAQSVHEIPRAESEKRFDDGVVDESTVIPPIAQDGVEGEQYEDSWQKIAIIMLGIYLALLLVSLDRTILGTAIPKITDEFNSINDVGWYASAYLLTTCAFQLIYGRIYTFFPAKWVLLGAIAIFEAGSVLCGAAPDSTSFIVGRAIAGVGGSGIFSGAIAVMIIVVPLHRRPLFQSLIGAVIGIASITGPLLGGAFTSEVTWRWCFYINLPIGAAVVLVLLFVLKTPPTKNTDTWRERLIKLDPWGTVVFLPGIICFLLAIEWGGNTYPWSSVRIIVLFVLSAVLIGIFLFIQYKIGENATLPFHIIGQRSIASGAFYSTVMPGAMMIMTYYLPIWHQAIKGVSPVASGINLLPMVMSLVVANVLAGIFTVKVGYYVPALLASSVITSIGMGLLITLTPSSGTSHWVGYEFILGFGLGLGMQQSVMAAQVCLAKKDVMTGASIMFFFQSLGGAIFVAIAQAVFTKSLAKNFAPLSSLANLSSDMLMDVGATELRNVIPAQYLGMVLVAYNKAMRDVWVVATALAAVTIFAGLTIEWRDMKVLREKSKVDEEKRKALKSSSTHGSERKSRDGDATSQTVVESPIPATPAEEEHVVKLKD